MLEIILAATATVAAVFALGTLAIFIYAVLEELTT